jgi:small subunit ribosomal protein S2
MLTNFKTVKNSIARLVELDEMVSTGATMGLTKKETLMLERERAKLNRSLSGIREMKGLPDALFVIDVDHERIAVSEARKLGIPVVGVCDTNSSPEGIDYLIPGNDDAIRAIRLYLQGAADAIIEAKVAAAPVIQGDADDYVEVSEEAASELENADLAPGVPVEAGAPAEKAGSVEEAAEVSSSTDAADRVDTLGAPAIPEHSESGQNDPGASKMS